MNKNIREEKISYKKRDLSKRKKKRIKKIKSWILSILLVVVVTIVCYESALYLGMFNKNAVNNAVAKSNYFYGVSLRTTEKACEYGNEYGIPKEVISGDDGYEVIFKNGKMYNEGIASIEAKLNGNEYQIDTSDVEKRLKNNIDQYIQSNNVEIDNASINALTQDITDYYEESIQLKDIQKYVSIRESVNKVIFATVPVMIILAILLLVLQFKIHDTKVGALKYVAYSASASVITALVIPLIILCIDLPGKWGINDEYLYNLITELMNSTIFASVLFGIGCLGVYIAILAYIFKDRANKLKD